MASTNSLYIFILFVVFFNVILGMFAISQDNFNINNYTPITQLRTNLENNHNWVSDILRVILIPFMVIDGLVLLITLLGLGFTLIPPILAVLIYTPLTLFVVFDYVIPTIRGN